MNMAVMEARMLFALALRELEIVRPLDTPVMQARFGTTRARGGIWLELRPSQEPRRTDGARRLSA
jgi:hypothetical protein